MTMSSDRTAISEVTTDDVPDYTHELALGVDIGVWQAGTLTHNYRGHCTRETAVDVRAYGSDAVASGLCRRYIAAWARRNLFEGAGPA